MSVSPWRSASRQVINFGTGAEQIARAALAQIMTNIEEQANLIEGVWASRDQDWASAMRIPYKPTEIILPENYYLGAQPSLVTGEGARFDKWPAITVRVGQRKASDDREQPDQYDSYDCQLIIEVLAAAGPFRVDPLDDRTTSDAIDRQYQRLSDAVIGCIDTDRSLGGIILPLKRPPNENPSLPMVKKLRDGAGMWTLYQGMELTYTVTSLVF